MTFSTRAMTDRDWEEIEYFHPSEFRAPKRMGFEFMQWLNRVRTRAGVAMAITSSWRSKKQNTTAGGVTDSAHMDEPLCEAVDIDPGNNEGRFRIVKAAMDEGCTRIGIYKNGSLHLDRTEEVRPAPRLWTVVK